jgi:hypothetical protein
VKIFRVASLDKLSVGDQVRIQYVDAPMYPLEVKDLTVEDSSNGS